MTIGARLAQLETLTGRAIGTPSDAEYAAAQDRQRQRVRATIAGRLAQIGRWPGDVPRLDRDTASFTLRDDRALVAYQRTHGLEPAPGARERVLARLDALSVQRLPGSNATRQGGG